MHGPPSLLLLSLLSFTPLSLAKGGDIPRGVNPKFADLYKPTSDDLFACHSDPSIKIPFSSVNDDYCDCPDGSDEPGTSACASLPAEKLKLPGFYCVNKGHIGQYIPFSRVNDGVCDYEECCDGSDESAVTSGGIKCENKCKEIGTKHRKEAKERKDKVDKGLKRNAELVAQAALLRKGVEDEIAALEGEILAKEADLKIKQEEHDKIEVEEKSRVLKGAKGKLKSLVELSKERVAELVDIAERLDERNRKLQQTVETLERILGDLKLTYDPNYNDAGVKAAVHAWEDYMGLKESTPAEEHIPVGDIHSETIDWNEWEADDEPEEQIVEEIYQIERYLPDFVSSWIRSRLSSIRQFLIDNNVLTSSSTSESSGTTTSSKALTKAREARDAVENSLNDARNKLSHLRDDLTSSYGPKDVFRSLKKKTVEVVSGEYTYQHNILENCQQVPSNGMKTHLGNFKSIEENVWDEDSDSFVTLIRYEDGTRCWNGPARSALVYIRCEPEDVLFSVLEAEKCVYRIDAGSPAVCGWGSDDKKSKEKDEL